MKSFDATFRYICEDIRYMYGTMAILYITFPITLIWCLLGILYNLDTISTAIFGPAYGLIISYGIFGFFVSLPIAVGLGSTRKHFLRHYFLLGIISILLLMIVLNLLEFGMTLLFEEGITTISLIDTGRLFFKEYNFFTYTLADASFGLFIFGLTSLITSIFYRLGFLKTAILFVAALFIISLFAQLGTFDGFMEWLVGLSKSVLLFLPAIVGISALISTYPIMIHTPFKQNSVRS